MPTVLALKLKAMESLQHKISYASDEEIIAKILDGENMLFEVLIRRYNPLLYKIARTYGFHHHDAEDLMQDSHFSAFQYLKRFRGEASYKTWLTRIHLNGCYQKLNKSQRDYDELTEASLADQQVISHTTALHQQTEQKVINNELREVLETSLQRIPLIYRSVFVLREIEGFNVTETSQLLSITPVNVKVRLNRAKTMLQEQLEKFYSTADLYEFHLRYCDKITRVVFDRIATSQQP
jgi:RNA polymerase sigma factor (sigma-70 family)